MTDGNGHVASDVHDAAPRGAGPWQRAADGDHRLSAEIGDRPRRLPAIDRRSQVEIGGAADREQGGSQAVAEDDVVGREDNAGLVGNQESVRVPKTPIPRARIVVHFHPNKKRDIGQVTGRSDKFDRRWRTIRHPQQRAQADAERKTVTVSSSHVSIKRLNASG